MYLVISLLWVLLAVLPSTVSSQSLSIFTWREDTAAAFPGTQQMVWVDAGVASQLSDGTYVIRAASVETASKSAITRLKPRAQRDRAVLISHAGVAYGPNGELPLFPYDDHFIDGYANGGFPNFTNKWMTEFWGRLKAEGIKPQLIIIDYEGAYGFWGLKRGFTSSRPEEASMPDWAVSTITAMRLLQERLGFSPTRFAPSDFVRYDGKAWRWNNEPIAAFNKWFLPRRALAIRRAIFEPAWNVYGDRIPASNYNEQERAWRGVDSNGWPMDPAPISGNWSSPNTYLTTRGNRYRLQFASKEISEVQTIEWTDKRNDVLSAIAGSWRVAPWYSNPDYGCDESCDIASHRLRWAAGLLHDRGFGVNTMLFWAPKAWTESEVQFARPIVDYILKNPPPYLVAISKTKEGDAQRELDRWTNLARSISAAGRLAAGTS